MNASFAATGDHRESPASGVRLQVSASISGTPLSRVDGTVFWPVSRVLAAHVLSVQLLPVGQSTEFVDPNWGPVPLSATIRLIVNSPSAHSDQTQLVERLILTRAGAVR